MSLDSNPMLKRAKPPADLENLHKAYGNSLVEDTATAQTPQTSLKKAANLLTLPTHPVKASPNQAPMVSQRET